MPDHNSQKLNVIPVTTARQVKQFIELPLSLYPHDSQWIAPLFVEQKQRLSRSKNPFFEHAEAMQWLACRDGRVVGRISAQIDQLHQQRHGEPVGYFGMMEAVDDQEVVNLLLQTAESWLRDQGIVTIRGPFNLGINEECGLLVEGFDTPPRIMMGHAQPYYAQRIVDAGYHKAKGLLAYLIDPDFQTPPVMRKLMDYAGDSVTVRPFRRKQLNSELEILRDIFNDAWHDNWGFVPFTKAEFADVGKLLTALIDEDFIAIAELHGRPVAMIIALPDINQAARDLRGRLLPFGWAKLLWRLKVKFPSQARVPLMGVRREFHHTRLGPALAFMVIDRLREAVVRKGVKNVELSWILENNTAMCNIIETIGGVDYKHYHIYEKSL